MGEFLIAILILAVLGALLLGVIALVGWVPYKYWKLKKRFRPILDLDAAVASRQTDIEVTQRRIGELEEEFGKKHETLSSEYEVKRCIYEALLREIGVVEEDLEMATFGLYKPHFDFDTSELYKAELTDVRREQREMIREKSAAVCQTEWAVEGSKSEGRKMTNRGIKLMLRAFNGECDAALLKVKWNNIYNMEERITRAFSAINKLGEPNHMTITLPYLDLKTRELRLAHEYAEKRHEEQEQQRELRQQMREEERAQREIEKALSEAEAEEKRYTLALKRAREEAGVEAQAEIDRLQVLLDEARTKRDRATSRAEMTKSGYVYVISNIGSFGDDVYKVGMTRRLEPMDRVRELGDASVPFPFDVHAVMFSQDAPALETSMHRALRDRQVNLVNDRKEFFRVELREIEAAATASGTEVEFTKLAEAQQYRESMARRLQQADEGLPIQVDAEKFPLTLDGSVVGATQ